MAPLFHFNLNSHYARTYTHTKINHFEQGKKTGFTLLSSVSSELSNIIANDNDDDDDDNDYDDDDDLFCF